MAVLISDREMGLEELVAVAVHGANVELVTEQSWLDTMQRSRQALEKALAAGVAVYGVSTGVGFHSSVAIAQDEQLDFAARLAQHHGCGVGEPFSDEEVRAIVFCRLVSLAKGYSAVRVELIQALCDLLNHGVIPVIPKLGSVGASGDLTPLSYLVAVLVGDREARYHGAVLPAREALFSAGLEPFVTEVKEPLALMNGTSVMTGVAALTVTSLVSLLVLADRTTALFGEVMGVRSGAFSPLPHALKFHQGQIDSAAAIRQSLDGSRLTDRPRPGGMVQDPYSIRCAPHVLGAARDAATWARTLVHNELNSVNDNPIIDPVSGEVVFAGNFYGGHIALAMDLVKVAAATLADLFDRQLALLLDSRFNLGLPETLVSYPGNGIKGLQLTTTALSALVAQRSGADSIQSRSTEVGNQDKVSMGLNAALNAAEAVHLLKHVLATQMIALSNAASLRDEQALSPAGSRLLACIRARSPVLEADRRLDHDIAELVKLVTELGADSTPLSGG